MKIGSVVHYLTLGARRGAKPLVRFDGVRRQGKEWEAFAAKNVGAEILTYGEWAEAERVAEAVVESPRWKRMQGARFEVALKWEESGIPCSTDGVDIIPIGDDLGDLKTAHTTNPELFKRQCFNMHYAQQLAFYRRGARANGINVRDLFIFGIENRDPYEDVELVLTPELIDFADKSVSSWFEDLRRNMLACPEPKKKKDWPGYTEAPQVVWDVPPWMSQSADEQQADAEAAEAA
jgi:hypothetical protein